MNTFVSKFGGTSLASSKEMRYVEQIASKRERRFIVVSAPGKRFYGDEKITDMLISCFNLAKEKQDFSKIFNKIKDRYIEIANDLHIDIDLDSEFEKIKENLALTPNFDYVVSRGEYLCGLIMSKYLNRKFVDASDFLVLSNSGRVNLNESQILFDNLFTKDGYYVVPGFYGRTKKGDIKTFPRGGSDITGAIVSYLSNALKYENFTDVDGVFDIDPNFSKLAHKIDFLTYDEMLKISLSGAKVLHPDCIKYLTKKNIVLNIRNTFNLIDKGTIVAYQDNKKS